MSLVYISVSSMFGFHSAPHQVAWHIAANVPADLAYYGDVKDNAYRC